MNKQYIDQGKEFPFVFTSGQMNFDSQTYTFPMSQNLQLDVRVKLDILNLTEANVHAENWKKFSLQCSGK